MINLSYVALRPDGVLDELPGGNTEGHHRCPVTGISAR
jgi:hypothetical protein